jgi:hypothetical protein
MKMNCWLILGAMIATSAVAQNNTNTPNTLPPIPRRPRRLRACAQHPGAGGGAGHQRGTRQTQEAQGRAPGQAHQRTDGFAGSRPGGSGRQHQCPRPGRSQGRSRCPFEKGRRGDGFGPDQFGQAQGRRTRAMGQNRPAIEHACLGQGLVIDATSKAVLPKKLNLRAGPGENYSVLGVIERGTVVNPITTKNDWMQIDPPANAYAFVAAMYLKQEAPAAPVPAPARRLLNPCPRPRRLPNPSRWLRQPPRLNQPRRAPVRIVSHEGVVRGVGSPVAPTKYELYDPATKLTSIIFTRLHRPST